MWQIIFLLAATCQHVLSAPQFVSLKDGKFGVNFGGYHAEAGLGGLLTGNAAHGGLSASAGTPFGQEAAAGLDGLVNGAASGGAYASASAGGNVGASAGLGGVAGEEITDSGLGAEAHAGGNSHSVVNSASGGLQITKQVTKVVQPPVEFEGRGDFYVSGASAVAAPSANVNVAEESTVVQKIKPPKKYAIEAAPTNTVVVEKRIEIPTVEAQVGLEAEVAAPKAQPVQVETVQEVVPVKVKHAPVTTTVFKTIPQQPAFNFQKSFGFNFGGGYGQAPAAVAPAAPAVPVAPVAPVVPVAEYYSPQPFVYRKHFRPWHHRVHFQKQYAPVVYQSEVVPVVEKRKQVVVQAAPAPAPVPVAVPALRSGYSGAGSFQGSVDTGTFFDSIFNIPIATLKAVNGLLNTKVQAGGGLAVQKSASLHVG